MQRKVNADYVFLGPAKSYHQAFVDVLSRDNSATLIFFCHGGEEHNLRGCNRESSQRRPFRYGTLISPTINIKVFSGKRVFCMACSSTTLGYHAIQAGAKVFLGFGDIKFNNSSTKQKRVADFTKFEVRKLIEECLLKAINENYSFNQLSWYLRYLINRRRNQLLSGDGHSDPHVRRQAAILLAIIKEGIVLFGDGSQLIN